MTQPVAADPRFFTIMHTLIYPGVLGSLMYAYPDNLVSGKTQFSTVGACLAFAFFLAFVFDYTHSVDEDAKPRYSPFLFALDLVIVLLLFCAGQRVLGTALLLWAPIPAFLAVAKVAGALWEMAADSPEDSARNTDFFFAFVYGVIWILSSGDRCWMPTHPSSSCWPGWEWVLAVALLVDAVSYLVYKRLATRYRRAPDDAGTA